MTTKEKLKRYPVFKVAATTVRGSSTLIRGGTKVYKLVERCELRWPGLCSQTAFAVIGDDWTFAAVACRKHAEQAEKTGYSVSRLRRTTK